MKLSEFINKYGDYEVTDELMDMVKGDSGEWRPKEGECYLYIDSEGVVCSSNWWGDAADNIRLEQRNVYRTKEEAKEALEMYEFCKERSIKPIWNDTEHHYCLVLNHNEKTATWCLFENCQDFAPFYYPSIDVVKEIINKYSFEELEKYYGRV